MTRWSPEGSQPDIPGASVGEKVRHDRTRLSSLYDGRARVRVSFPCQQGAFISQEAQVSSCTGDPSPKPCKPTVRLFRPADCNGENPSSGPLSATLRATAAGTGLVPGNSGISSFPTRYRADHKPRTRGVQRMLKGYTSLNPLCTPGASLVHLLYTARGSGAELSAAAEVAFNVTLAMAVVSSVFAMACCGSGWGDDGTTALNRRFWRGQPLFCRRVGVKST